MGVVLSPATVPPSQGVPVVEKHGVIPQLDGLRGVAILLVLLTHLVALHLPAAGGVWIDRVVRQGTHLGWTGVDLFFVLSGFLITGGLIDTRGRARYWTNYLGRRCLRIFPLYYGVLVFLFVALPHLVRWTDPSYAVLRTHQVWYWTYTVNILQVVHGLGATPLYTAHFWSLSIEEQFYLFWPLVIWALAPRRLPIVAGAVVAFGVLFRFILCVATTVGPGAAYVLTPGRLDGLMVGAALAATSRFGGLARWRPAAVKAVAVSAIGVGVLVAWRGTDYTDPVMAVVGYPLIAILFGAFLVVALTGDSRTSRILSKRGLCSLGRYSYGIYLLHYPLIGVLDDRLGPRLSRLTLGGSHLPGVAVLIAAGMPLVFGSAWVSYHVYEKRFLALKKYFK